VRRFAPQIPGKTILLLPPAGANPVRRIPPCGAFSAPGRKNAKKKKFFLHLQGSSAIMYKLPFRRKAVNTSKEVLQLMAKCQFCDKDVAFGIKVSHSHRRSNRTWKPNVKRVKAIVNGSPEHVYVCTRCLRSGKVTRAV
jgi:large subunit ribosomal protein L28